jgi:hypothetical protein
MVMERLDVFNKVFTANEYGFSFHHPFIFDFSVSPWLRESAGHHQEWLSHPLSHSHSKGGEDLRTGKRFFITRKAMSSQAGMFLREQAVRM